MRSTNGSTLGDPRSELPISTTRLTWASTHLRWCPGPCAGDDTHCMKCCHTLDPIEWAIKHTCMYAGG